MSLKRHKGEKGKADVAFSKIIRSIEYCEAEGYGGRRCAGRLECAHIISRRYNATRTDTRNALSLCSGHHFWFTSHPLEFSRFVSTTWARQYYDQLYEKSITPTKVNWGDRIAFLQRIENGEFTINEARSLEDD